MQQVSGQSITTIVSETSLGAVLSEIRSGVTYPDFFENRYTDESDELAVDQQEEQEQGVEVVQ